MTCGMGFSPNMEEKSCHDVYAKYVNDLFTLYASSLYTWGGGGDTPYNGLYEEASAERVSFSDSRYMKG